MQDTDAYGSALGVHDLSHSLAFISQVSAEHVSRSARNSDEEWGLGRGWVPSWRGRMHKLEQGSENEGGDTALVREVKLVGPPEFPERRVAEHAGIRPLG